MTEAKAKDPRGGSRSGTGPKRVLPVGAKRATFYLPEELLERIPRSRRSLFVLEAIREKLEREKEA